MVQGQDHRDGTEHGSNEECRNLLAGTFSFFSILPFLFLRLFVCLFVCLFEREHKPCGEGAAGAEGEADPPLSRKPQVELHTKTLGP